MIMTNYMDLLAANSPWNLIMFMVIPMLVAECLVATEFFAVYYGERADKSKRWNRILSIVAGVYYTAIVVYFLLGILPAIEYRGWIDTAALVAFVGAAPFILALALMELGVWGNAVQGGQRILRRFFLLISFLIISHLTMIFGMADPTLSGWQPQTSMQHPMPEAGEQSQMPMQHHHMMTH